MHRQWFLYCDGKDCSLDGGCCYPDDMGSPANQRRAARRKCGWTRRKVRGRWMDLCDDCKTRPEYQTDGESPIAEDRREPKAPSRGKETR